MKQWWSSWRLALRLGRRDIARSPGRSILVVVMIALPVLGVTAADVVIQTADVDSREAVDRTLGTQAEALVEYTGRTIGVQEIGGTNWEDGGSEAEVTRREFAESLADRPRLELREGYLSVVTDIGAIDASVMEYDPGSPLADGLSRLTDGRWPEKSGEVVVNAAIADRGLGVGESLSLFGDEETSAEIVGIAEDADQRDDHVVAWPGSLLPDDPTTTWLLGGDPVSWDEVEEFNQQGATVVSRSMLMDPSAAALAADDRARGDDVWLSPTIMAVIAMIAVMALLEVILLAGPAMAVGVKRQTHTLALLGSAGSSPRQLRRVVLGQAAVLGGIGAAIGLVLGPLVAYLALPVVQEFTTQFVGPFGVPWLRLLIVAACGVVSAILAAVVPAWVASRLPIAAALAGRRADGRPSRRSPVLGLMLLGGGVAAAFAATTRLTQSTEYAGSLFAAASALLSVLGMVLVAPVVVALLGRVGQRLSLGMRFAIRDAARHRTRTVPAVAAVAATVAGAVTLGIATTSDEAGNAATYRPQLPMGQAEISVLPSDRTTLTATERVIAEHAPEVSHHALWGVSDAPTESSYQEVIASRDRHEIFPDSATGGAVVDDGSGVDRNRDIPDEAADQAREVLEAGGAVIYSAEEADAGHQRLRLQRTLEEFSENSSKTLEREKALVEALVVYTGRKSTTGAGVLSPRVADRLGAEVTPLRVQLGEVSDSEARDLREALNAAAPEAYLYVERGYQVDDDIVILQLVLACLAAVLMLGGTLTATFLALSDARPDLATLAAVGAPVRLRRRVAAAYGFAISAVGATLGVIVGFVPGVALAHILTNDAASIDGVPVQAVVAVPWFMVLGLIVGLPLLAAGVVALVTRNRLPMVSRVA